MPLDSSPPQTYAGNNSVLRFMKKESRVAWIWLYC
ncbi:hypothetical protein T09_3313 [Trichinella sp. T9]|nr:hypothetical protein T09_3313 [Trichinella sp. T9]